MTDIRCLPRSFYARKTLEVARQLLGVRLIRQDRRGAQLEGLIVECEAYVGTQDLGCHARSGLTPRNQVMWGPAGHAYIYFTYGMHWMLNVVTEQEGFPAAVLIRAIHPTRGLELMRQARAGRPDHQLTDGPAKLCQALRLTGELNGHDLCAGDTRLWLAAGHSVPERLVTTSPRVGLNNVPEPWKSIPWRFLVEPRHLQRIMEEAGSR